MRVCIKGVDGKPRWGEYDLSGCTSQAWYNIAYAKVND